MKFHIWEVATQKKRIVHFKKPIYILQVLEKEYELPKGLLVSILLIETKCRPLYFRIAEYIAMLIDVIINRIINRPIKNYTVGKCQLGVASILNYLGDNIYPYVEYIPRLNKNQAILLMKALFSDEYYKILAYKIKPIYNRAINIYSPLDLKNVICFIGEQYNGKYTYGLLLSTIVEEYNNSGQPAGILTE